MRVVLWGFCLIGLLLAAPLGLQAARYWYAESEGNWYSADRSSMGFLPAITPESDAIVRIYAARTVRWRSIFAVHSWIVVKEKGGTSYERFDKVGWGGEPIRRNGYVPDGRWFGHDPEVVFAADGAEAERLIPQIKRAIAGYAYRNAGDYQVWPGPNSNTFVASVMAAVPEIQATLPPVAIGKDFPANGKWVGLTGSRTGVYATLGGYVGITLGWVEGIELNLFGGVIGLDIRNPGIKLPGIGRIGV
ncbi:DUF3750 domain-containing protein [Lacibacterium aquatile]|uniref:DUF3750 domain-containing protein n=1 Tax=Lacibacterium aquatile TaxID=1168082 RepID=A0ABW5DTB1_9PROT